MSDIEPTNSYGAISYDFSSLTAIPDADLAAVLGLLTNTPATLAELADYLSQNVLTQFLFQARIPAPNGSFVVQQSVAQKAGTEEGQSEPFSTVAPGGAFPIASVGETEPSQLTTAKIAAKAIIALEDVLAYRRSAVNTAFSQLSNTYSDTADGLSVAAITASVPATGDNARAVAATETVIASTTVDQVLRPILVAKATIKDARMGYQPDVAIMSELNAAVLASSAPIAQILAYSQQQDAPIFSGALGKLGGLEIVPVPSELCEGNALLDGLLVLDHNRLGGLAETIPFRSNSVYNQANLSPAEAWVVSLAHNFAPYVQAPLSACWVTGLFDN